MRLPAMAGGIAPPLREGDAPRRMRLPGARTPADGIVRSEEEARAVLARLDALRRTGPPVIGFDTETTGWDPKVKMTPYDRARCALFSLSDGVDSWALDGTLLGVFRDLFEAADVRWRGVNLKFDAAVLWNHGVRLAGRHEDCRIMSKLRNVVEPRTQGLKQLARHDLGLDMTEFKDIGRMERGRNPTTEFLLANHTAKFAEYARRDALVPVLLGERLLGDLRRIPWTGDRSLEDLYVLFEEPFGRVLLDMERRGVIVDQERLTAIAGAVRQECEDLGNEMERIAGGRINTQSSDQMCALFFGKLGYEPSRFSDKKFRCGLCGLLCTRRTARRCPEHGTVDLRRIPTLNKFALEALAARSPEARTLMRLRKVDQYRKAFIPQLSHPCADGRVRPSWKQYGARSGRLSCSAPNLMSIPVREDDPDHPDPARRGFGFRSLFLPSPGNVFMVADLDNVELRVAAHLSGDANMLRAIRDGADLHSETAVAVFGLTCPAKDVKRQFPDVRAKAKTLNFAVLYGAGVRRAQMVIGCGPDEARERMDLFFGQYPGLLAYKRATEDGIRRMGFKRSLLGRRHHFPFMYRVATSPALAARYDARDEKVRSQYQAELREAVNFGCQGGTADIMQTVMLVAAGHDVEWHPMRRTDALLRLGAVQVMQIHDENVFEVPEGSAREAGELLGRIMRDPVPGLRVPITASVAVGPTWSKD